jgi:hypothetical protein
MLYHSYGVQKHFYLFFYGHSTPTGFHAMVGVLHRPNESTDANSSFNLFCLTHSIFCCNRMLLYPDKDHLEFESLFLDLWHKLFNLKIEVK